MGMVRKQLYVDVESNEKLKRLAAVWRCSEAEVVRRAIANVDAPVLTSDREKFASFALLLGAREPAESRSDELGAVESEFRARLQRRSAPIGLSVAVLDDRAGR